MSVATSRERFPQGLWVPVAVYFAASLAHFVHNAEYIAFYPNMPDWITRENVYLAWLGVTSVGLLGLAVFRFGFQAVGALLVGMYGACGLDSLAHYTLALCSEHTLAANLTIWLEVATGVVVMLSATLLAYRLIRR